MTEAVSPESLRRNLRIIWMALCAALIPYTVIAWLNRYPASSLASPLTTLLPAVGAMKVLVAFIWYQFTVGRLAAADSPTARAHRTPEQQWLLSVRAQSHALVCLCLLEAPAVYGVILHLVGGSTTAVWGLLGGSFVSLVLFRVAAFPAIDRLLQQRPPA